MSNNLKEEIYLFVSTLPDWQKILSAYLLGFIDDEVQKETVIENALKTLLFGSNLIEENPEKLEFNIPETSDESFTKKHRNTNLFLLKTSKI